MVVFLRVQQFKSNRCLWRLTSLLCRFLNWIGSQGSGGMVGNGDRQTIEQVAKNVPIAA